MNELILIIDDSELILQMLEMVCQQHGYRTVTCATVNAVEEAVADQTPAVIVSDLNLPGIDGQNPVATLHGMAGLESIPIVIVSGLADDELADAADQIGADAAISKQGGMPAVQSTLPGLLDACCA